MSLRDDWIQSIGYYDTQDTTKVRALVYGPTGVGKTTFAGTFPKPFFIDSDKGGLTLKSKNIPFVPLVHGDKAYAKVVDILQAIKQQQAPFDKLDVKTIVFDSLTSLMDMFIYEAMKYPQPGKLSRDPVNTKPEWDDYAAIGSRMKDIMLRCKDLNLHVVALSGEKLEKDELRGTFVGQPNITGSYRNVIGHDFDEVYYMSVEGTGEKLKHYLFTSKFKYYEAKSRMDLQTDKFESPTFDKLYKDMFNKEPEA